MTTGEMPAVGHSTYSAQALNLGQAEDLQANYMAAASLNQMAATNQFTQGQAAAARQAAHLLRRVPPAKEPDMSARRLVQVFIVDPDPRLPLEWCVIHQDEKPRITDATDQELFYEIDIRALLQVHNERRATVIDKKVKERVEHLEHARIRDLRMQIVEVAKF